MDFVQEVETPVIPEPKWPKVKCVVWDLDNTVWDGVLIEDGPDRLTLKPGISDVIKELDRRGILQSVASKNDYDHARPVLDRFGLAEFFLYPQISWGAEEYRRRDHRQETEYRPRHGPLCRRFRVRARTGTVLLPRCARCQRRDGSGASRSVRLPGRGHRRGVKPPAAVSARCRSGPGLGHVRGGLLVLPQKLRSAADGDAP